MLQQNNNNNYPCLEMAHVHREVLQECQKSSIPFKSHLEFWGLPLIKGLRAWVVSGTCAKSKRMAAPSLQQQLADASRYQTWSVRPKSSYKQKSDTSASSSHRTTGVRQSGLGALVTVATLKASQGGRQTQTHCLFLKAEGGSYLCAVAPQTQPALLENWLEETVGEVQSCSKGENGNHDGDQNAGVFKVKPRSVRKWRKSVNAVRSTDKRAEARSRKDVFPSGLSEQHGDKRNSQVDILEQHLVRGASERQSPQSHRPADRHKSSSVLSDPAGQSDQSHWCEQGKEDSLHPPRSESSLLKESSDTAISSNYTSAGGVTVNTYVQTKTELSSSDEVSCKKGLLENGRPTPVEDNKEDTEFSKSRSGLVADEYSCHLKGNMVLHMSKTCSNDAASNSNHQEKLELTRTKLLAYENKYTVKGYHPQSPKRDKDQDSVGNVRPEEDAGQFWEQARHKPEPEELERMCEQWSLEGESSECGDAEVGWPNKSPSQGLDTLTVTTAYTLTNPLPLGSMATALPVQQREKTGTGGGAKPVLLHLQQQEQESVQDEGKVATDGRCFDVGQEVEDEFGVFLQAGEQQLWEDGFTEFHQVPCAKGDGNADKHISWTSDWMEHPVHRSEDKWTAFTQEINSLREGLETASGGQWWPSSALENTSARFQTSCNYVHSVFLEAFPSVLPSSGDSDYIPTLEQLLQQSAEQSTATNHRDKSLLDGLQDLERILDVKYKGAESLSQKLLLQSLHLNCLNTEQAVNFLPANERISPELPTSNQEPVSTVKRRLSYDLNRNIMA